MPNSRLYRPGPLRPRLPQPPPARPRAVWPPPAPPRTLDTASHAALRLGTHCSAPAPAPLPARSPSLAAVARAQRLVVTLPELAARYRPASEHFRARATPAGSGSGESTPPAARVSRAAAAAAPCVPLPAAPCAMEAAGRQSASPEDRSEGKETLSAPSEFLAEVSAFSRVGCPQYACSNSDAIA